MTGRFDRPVPGAPTEVRFPPIARETLANGLRVWSIRRGTVPLVTTALIIARGTVDDPEDRHGLASLTGDLVDEGAGVRDAIELADAFGRIGAQFDIDVGPDATSLSLTSLARDFETGLALLADVVIRPRIAAVDFDRVRDLRLHRLRQLSRSAGTMADRTYVSALFGPHSYGHGALGTTASLDAISVEDARAFWAGTYAPASATLIVGGDIAAADAVRAAASVFGSWGAAGVPLPGARPPDAEPDRRLLLVDRPGAPQSELRLGHVGPPRTTPAYHALVTLNALLGGQFTSRLNRRLREERGVTYGVRTSFDFRRMAGTFSCETSVQGDATASAIGDVLEELEDVARPDAVTLPELERAKASLTRGYVRSFETAGQLVRAAAQLAIYELPDDTFDRFVPEIERITPEGISEAARQFVRARDATVVVVGDAAACAAPLAGLGRPVVTATPEF